VKAYGDRLRHQWLFDGESPEWNEFNDCDVEIRDGMMHITSRGIDPFVVAHDLSIPGGELLVTMRAKFDIEGVGQCFWVTDLNQRWGDMMAVFQFENHDTLFQEYQFPINVKGKMTAFRLDPGFEDGTVQIDWIRILAREQVVADADSAR